MGIKNLPCKIVLFLGLTAAAFPALAEVPDLAPLNHSLRYDVAWNGMPLGRIRIEVREDTFKYSMSIDTKTRGIATLFNNERGLADAAGRVDLERGYAPQRYQSHSDGAGRKTTITYNDDGTIKTRTRTPEDDPAWRPMVPPDQANTATDPISAFFLLRRAMHQNIADNVRDTTVRTYEGARLASFTFRVISRARIEMGDTYVTAINTVPTRTMIAGYTPKEIKKAKEKADPTVHVYFSADEKFIPLSAKVNLAFGTLSATLADIKPAK